MYSHLVIGSPSLLNRRQYGFLLCKSKFGIKNSYLEKWKKNTVECVPARMYRITPTEFLHLVTVKEGVDGRGGGGGGAGRL